MPNRGLKNSNFEELFPLCFFVNCYTDFQIITDTNQFAEICNQSDYNEKTMPDVKSSALICPRYDQNIAREILKKIDLKARFITVSSESILVM